MAPPALRTSSEMDCTHYAAHYVAPPCALSESDTRRRQAQGLYTQEVCVISDIFLNNHLNQLFHIKFEFLPGGKQLLFFSSPV